MSDTLIVSERGQITLPATIRKKYGIKGGSALIIEERNNELLLKPAAIMELDIYSDDQIAEWDKADQLTERERARIIQNLEK
ncbi:MAG TPA: AbrB/MazE/SpoVT family DNA-binding domain-containing protein [Bacteroidales bacterium]|nr:AbrB/MazE/SpoVT family DNA-binding domain-containing protein [Bacteroidales bacterium]